jgi:16S rRNA (adenine1518-N6/adenine1519-N6)-dimethyltransferase
MHDDARQTRSRLIELFAQQGLQPRHDLGQNFLVDLNLHELIVRHARLDPADVVLEVGSGTGGLTARLADHAGHVVSVECDPHVFAHAQQLLAGRSNVTLIHADALASKHALAPEVMTVVDHALQRVQQAEADRHAELDQHAADPEWAFQPRPAALKLVANLPYQVATPIMSNLIAGDWPWTRMVVTIQWELAQRMLAQPGTSDYSALTVWMQAQARLQVIRKLPPSVFWPPPKVDSAVLLVERDPERQARIRDRPAFQHGLRDIFTQRRKRLLGVLAKGLPDRSFPAAGWTREHLEHLLARQQLRPDVRAEQLTVSQLVDLVNQLLTSPAIAPAADSTPVV